MRSTSSISALVLCMVGCAAADPVVVGIDDTDAAVTPTPAGTAPVVADRRVAGAEDQTTTVFLSALAPSTAVLTWRVLTQPAHGELSGEAPELTYTPAPDFHGEDGFTFEVESDGLVSDVAQVTIDVRARNDAPILSGATLVTHEDTAALVSVVAVDPDGDSVRLRLGAAPAHGSVTDGPGGLTYVPAADYHGADRFTVTGWDGIAASTPVDVLVTVNPVQDPPVVGAQRFTTAEDVATTIVLAGSDADGDVLTWTVGAPAHGQLTGEAPRLSYQPNPDFHGDDTFTVVASDGQADAAPATVTVTVTAAPDAPVTHGPVSVAAWAGEPVTFQLPASDVDGDALTWSLTASASQGVLFGRGPSFTFTPHVDARGPITLLWTVRDSTGRSSAADTVTFDVDGPSRPPVASADTYDAVGNAGLTVQAARGVLANDVDPDGELLTVVPRTAATVLGGLLTLRADGSFDYLPPVARSGIVDRFAYVVTDAAGNTDQSEALLRVNGRVWFVDSAAAPDGDGRSSRPFDTLEAAESASSEGDVIALAPGVSTTTGYPGPIVLREGQSLWGGAVPLVVGGITLRPAGVAPLLTSTEGPAVVMARGSSLRGVWIDVAGAEGVRIDGVDDVVVEDVVVLDGASDAVVALDARDVVIRGLSSVGGSGAAVRAVGVRDLVVERLSAYGCAVGVALSDVRGTVDIRDAYIDGAQQGVSVGHVDGALALTLEDVDIQGVGASETGIAAALDGAAGVDIDVTLRRVSVHNVGGHAIDLPLRSVGSDGGVVAVRVEDVVLLDVGGDGLGLRLREGARARLVVRGLTVTGGGVAASGKGIVVEALDGSVATVDLADADVSGLAVGLRLQSERGGDVVALASGLDLDGAERDVDVVRGALGQLDLWLDSGVFRGAGGLAFDGGSADGQRLVLSLLDNAAAGPFALRSGTSTEPIGSLALVGTLNVGAATVNDDGGNVAAEGNTTLGGGAPVVQVSGRLDIVGPGSVRTP